MIYKKNFMVGYARSVFHYLDCLFSLSAGYFVAYERHVRWRVLLAQEFRKIRKKRTGERNAPERLDPF